MAVRIACSGGACTVIRTNPGGLGLGPWTHPLPLAFADGAWRASGQERNASACHSGPAPTSVTLILRIMPEGQLSGIYTATQGATSCGPSGSISGVYVVATDPLRKWRGNNAIGQAEQLAERIWQIIDTGSQICDVLHCKFIPPSAHNMVTFVDDLELIRWTATADQQAIVLFAARAAMDKAIANHSPDQTQLAQKAQADWIALRTTLAPPGSPLSLVWPPIAS